MDYSIGPMQLHRDGFYFAVVKSHHTQAEATAHNRYGAWFIGNPDAPQGTETMKDVLPGLAAALQARMLAAKKDIAKISDNPFLNPPAPAPASTTTPNPFLALS